MRMPDDDKCFDFIPDLIYEIPEDISCPIPYKVFRRKILELFLVYDSQISEDTVVTFYTQDDQHFAIEIQSLRDETPQELEQRLQDEAFTKKEDRQTFDRLKEQYGW